MGSQTVAQVQLNWGAAIQIESNLEEKESYCAADFESALIKASRSAYTPGGKTWALSSMRWLVPWFFQASQRRRRRSQMWSMPVTTGKRVTRALWIPLPIAIAMRILWRGTFRVRLDRKVLLGRKDRRVWPVLPVRRDLPVWKARPARWARLEQLDPLDLRALPVLRAPLVLPVPPARLARLGLKVQLALPAPRAFSARTM
jgi:hypothetical protein